MSMNGHDKAAAGGTDIAIGIHDGQVVMHWRQPTNAIAFDPQNAFEFGEQIARAAHKARFGEDAPSDKSYLAGQVRSRVTEDMRGAMINRATVMIRSMTEQNKSHDYMARQIVDTIFAEVA